MQQIVLMYFDIRIIGEAYLMKYIALTLIPLRISFVSLIRSSFLRICTNCSSRSFVTIVELMGIKSVITANPARVDGPSSHQTKYRANKKRMGEVQSWCWKVGASWIRWASTAIRLTICPTVVLRRAPLLRRRACKRTYSRRLASCH